MTKQSNIDEIATPFGVRNDRGMDSRLRGNDKRVGRPRQPLTKARFFVKVGVLIRAQLKMKGLIKMPGLLQKALKVATETGSVLQQGMDQLMGNNVIDASFVLRDIIRDFIQQLKELKAQLQEVQERMDSKATTRICLKANKDYVTMRQYMRRYLLRLPNWTKG